MLTSAYRLARPLLFMLDPERAHGLAFHAGAIAQHIPGCVPLVGALAGKPDPSIKRSVCGLEFPSPVGLAAGLDKGAQLLPLWKSLGFGFVEIGTVTPRPQPGNPKPRLFRLPEENLILNRMGFNSEGAEAVAQRLKARPRGLVVGGNIGKNRTTAEADALEDYRAAYRHLAPVVDYIALNVSSPNTPGLRNLQAPKALTPLLAGMLEMRKEMGLEAQPLFLKLAPDLPYAELDATVETALESGISGLIATNTTLDRSIVSELNRARVEAWGEGGLSGRGLKIKAQAVQRRILDRLAGRMPLMACGGIGSTADVQRALSDGAALAQVYSALIFEGPGLPGRINRELASAEVL